MDLQLLIVSTRAVIISPIRLPRAYPLQVRRTIARVASKGFTISKPKTPKSRRSIQLAQMAIDALKHHRIRQRELRLLAGPAWSDQGWVFCNGVGNPFEATNMLRRS